MVPLATSSHARPKFNGMASPGEPATDVIGVGIDQGHIGLKEPHTDSEGVRIYQGCTGPEEPATDSTRVGVF